MAEKKIKIQLDIDSNIEPTIANLKLLKKQLKETAAGSAEFNKISAQIRDLDDSIKDASAGADDFAGYLENASGPLGMLGKGLRGAEKSFSSFNAILKTSVIGILVAAIGGLVAAFSQSETAMKKLQPIFIAFEKILGGIFKAFEPVLDAFLEMATSALPYITKGIGMFYSGLYSLFTLVKNVGVSVGKILKGVFTLDFDSLKEGAAGIKDAFLSVGKTFEDTYKRFEEGTNEQTKTEKLNAEERQKLADEAQKKREEAAAKAEKLREEQQKLNDAANAVELEAFKSSLDERARAEYEAGLVLEQQRATLAAAGRTDATAIEEQYRSTIAGIKKKYDDEAAKIQEGIDAKTKADLLKKNEEERAILLSGLQSKFEILDAENQRVELDFEADLQRFADQRAILAEQEATELQNTELTEFQKTEIRKKYADARKGISDGEIATEKAAMQARNDINMAYLGLFQQFGSVLGQLAGKNKALAIAGVVIQQAAAIGQIIASTAIANAKAVAASPLTFGAPWTVINSVSAGLSIASTIAAGIKSVQQINSAASAGGVSGGGGGTALSAGGTSIVPPTLPSTAAPQIQSGGDISPSQQIANTIASATNRPIKAYVVSGDISSQQALDRRTTRAATFSGG
jgi:hypothetical protein